MFKRILVPLDGSSRAELALPVTARIAHYSGSSVLLVLQPQLARNIRYRWLPRLSSQ
jgi:nucleotide-binding universal stress UspA family protein